MQKTHKPKPTQMIPLILILGAIVVFAIGYFIGVVNTVAKDVDKED